MRREERQCACPPRLRVATGCARPVCPLTFLPMDQDGGVGPRAAVALHGVAVSAVVILVPEGAVLHHLFRWTHRLLAWHRDPSPPLGAPQGPEKYYLLRGLPRGLGKGARPLTREVTRMKGTALPRAATTNSLV